MKRRSFITLLGGAAAAWPLAAFAQEPGRMYRLGAMIPSGQQSPAIAAFFDEMRLFGFIEGQNLTVLPNGFGVRNDELDERADALVKAAPDVIIGGPDNYTRVLQQRTRTIPLVARNLGRLCNSFGSSSTTGDPLYPHRVPIGHRPGWPRPCRGGGSGAANGLNAGFANADTSQQRS